ncbi:EscU/YscU/HrcU family type III secretion system export apparatus switch protein [Heliorestis convoluta]|uniref:Flagellar biosynthesis protein FlhS n=1 Tax=Heliorestis convoluta TaxID=356322 RepID=A0A5Q2N2L0_9FIRM|nr:EscU/YscU/HrcU family type III secretion system export apparatus switch protein [Heliorestis convoluta]QGG47512.1 flagellar biosynthesis protein FlhS [Heliorestis convoluta]
MTYQYLNGKKKKKLARPSVVLLRYEEGNDTPTVSAQGTGHIAQQIMNLAKANNIPIEQNSQLLDNLLDMDFGDQVPPQFYQVLAETLLMLKEMEKN